MRLPYPPGALARAFSALVLAASCTLAAASAAVSGCAPLTFSNPGAIDFERYRSVRVEPVVSPLGAYGTQYLVDELEAISGFETVESGRGTHADLVLEVVVRVVERTEIDSAGYASVEYESRATFRARASTGEILDEGDFEDESGTAEEAVEDALDRVAHHFLRPYRA
jgi:hypothetical protein